MGGGFHLLRHEPLALACTYVSGAAVTPSGVRDGDPAALAALCAVRGPSVLAYCRHIAGEADAGAAAADAFARFRVAVVAAGDTSSLNPEALLISATRTSAAARASGAAQGDCADVPALLAARADKTIAAADLERLESHLEQCWTCRAPVARFQAAERAYRDPPEKTIEPALTEQIVEALLAAVPSSNGADAGHHAAEPVADPHGAQAVANEQPTEHFAAPGMTEAGTAPAAAGAGRPPRLRAQRGRRQRARPGRRVGVVLALVLVVLALVGALFVSGVFGGDDPASSSDVTAPAADPGVTSESEVVVVPGAKDASADAVETAKARKRARERRGSGTAKKDSDQAADAAQAGGQVATTPPPAAAPPPPRAAAVTPPPPPPARAGDPVTRPAPERRAPGDDQKQIDAGSGATGAEQIPPPQDTSNVPDLAPPP